MPIQVAAGCARVHGTRGREDTVCVQARENGTSQRGARLSLPIHRPTTSGLFLIPFTTPYPPRLGPQPFPARSAEK